MSKVKQVILSVAIAIVLALFIGYGIATFYKSPKYDDYCKDFYRKPIDTQELCETQGGNWVEPEIKDQGLRLVCYKRTERDDGEEYICNPDPTVRSMGYCNIGERPCDEEYRADREVYNRNVFVITLILGIIGLIIGGVILKLETVSSGIMGGSVLTIIYGTIRYWGEAPDALRFTILGVVLLVLIWLGYKKLNPIFNKPKRK